MVVPVYVSSMKIAVNNCYETNKNPGNTAGMNLLPRGLPHRGDPGL